MLDWFHITTRITVMRRYVKGLSHHDPDEGRKLDRLRRHFKGYLWNGNIHGAHHEVDELVMDLECIETDYPSVRALRKAAGEFEVYIRNNARIIPNYAERRRYGERVSAGFVERRVPSTRLSTNALASASSWSGQSLVQIFSFRPGREFSMARSGGSSNSGTHARGPATLGSKLNHALHDCPTPFSASA